MTQQVLSMISFEPAWILTRYIPRLLLLGAALAAVALTFLAAGKRHARDNRHPWFGRHTVRIPNMMCMMRFPLALWIVLVHYVPSLHTVFWHWTIHLSFAMVCLLDALDGRFARKWNAITPDGKSLDPAADKFVTVCLAATACMHDTLPLWALIVVAGREIVSVIQRRRMQRRGIDVSARWLGKLKTGVQFTVLYILILRIESMPVSLGIEYAARALPDSTMLWVTLLMCFITVISIFPYFTSFSYVNDYEFVPRENRNVRFHVSAVPTLFTIGNYLCGVTAVYFAMPQVEVINRPFVILFWLLVAALCDALDGPVARRLHAHSEFGACLDSSTDLSTFGLAVAAIIYLQFSELRDVPSLMGVLIAGIYFLSVHLRLARFTRMENERPDHGSKADFVGLPSPSGAVGVLIFFTFFKDIWLLSLLVILISFLMYSRLNYVSHSNAVQSTFYRLVMIPPLLVGFGLLTALMFWQPFVSRFSPGAGFAFRATAWVLVIPFLMYVFDGIRRSRPEYRN